MTKKSKKLVAIFIFIIAVTGTVAFLAYAGLFNFWQLKLSDILKSGRFVSDDIVIVAIGENTVADTGLGQFANWQRDNYARIFTNIRKYHPRLIAFDIFLKDARDQQKDNIFRDALSEANSPVIIYRMNPSKYDDDGFFVQEPDVVANPLPLELFSTLENVVVSTAAILPDGDNVYRRIMPFVKDEQSGRYYENFPFAIARIFLTVHFIGFYLPIR